MTQLPDKELISAYVDGELTPPEREEVERLLAALPEARQELAEVRALTSLLQNFPQESAPPEFKSRVMQAAERGMLLADAAPSVSFAAAASQRAQAKKVNWWPAAGVILAAAAALMMMVVFFGPGVDPAQVAQDDESAVNEVAERDIRDGFRPDDTKIGRAEAAEAPAALDEPQLAATASLPAAPSETSHLVFDRNLSEARVGEVLSAFETSGGKVAVCKVTVMDMRDGLEQLEVLLLKQRIEPDPAVSATDKAKIAAPESGQMVAIYVEATREQLSPALAALKDEPAFRDQQLQVEEPVDSATLDSQVAELARFRGAQPAAPKEGQRRLEAAAQAAAPEQKTDSDRALAKTSRQKPVNVSTELLSGAKDHETAERPADASAVSEGEELRESEPLQVLFVLIPAEARTRPTTSPAAQPES